MRAIMTVSAVAGAILVVGETGGAAADLAPALDAAGFCVLRTPEVPKAVAFLEAAAFDVIVVDVGTPDGRRFVEHVRVRRPFTEVVMVPGATGDAADADLRMLAIRDALERVRHRGRLPDVAGRAILTRIVDP
jgi:DNA-binding response OmpR family regulator